MENIYQLVYDQTVLEARKLTRAELESIVFKLEYVIDGLEAKVQAYKNVLTIKIINQEK